MKFGATQDLPVPHEGVFPFLIGKVLTLIENQIYDHNEMVSIPYR